MHYRKIWETKYGKIPNGYDVHHIDGNKSNNCIENLKAVSLEEHFNIHYNQGDYAAAQAILIRLEISNTWISSLASKAQIERLNNGTHNFQLISKEKRKEISTKVGYRTLLEQKGIHAINTNPILAKENARNAGIISKQNNAGFHDPNKTGGIFVKNTYWWTNIITKKRKRQKDCPGENWIRGMK